MENPQADINDFWETFIQTSGREAAGATFEAWSFGSTPRVADELAELVLQGVKTATASLVWSYEFGSDPYPEEGGYSIILSGSGRPVCIIRTLKLSVRPFDEVDAEQAFLEGEGDRSLAYWREAHWKYFGEECRLLGCEPDLKMPVLCERFEVVFPANK
jgi:uncharacterized protein YhfF